MPDAKEIPLPIISEPLPPLTVLPLLSNTTPLLPTAAEPPLATLTDPLVRPAAPELKTTPPLHPDPERPLPTNTEPEEPANALPLLNTSEPLTPLTSAFADRNITLPDDDTDPAPLTICTTPPTLSLDVDDPAYTYTSPPVALLLLPTAMEIEPARPELASPVPTTT